MKSLFIIMSIFFNYALSAQSTIVESNQILSLKQNEFLKHSEIKNITINNSENNPFIALTVVLKGNDPHGKFLIRDKTDIWSSWKELKEDFDLKEANFNYKHIEYISPTVTEIEVKLVNNNDENEISEIILAFYYPNKTKKNNLVKHKINNSGKTSCNCLNPIIEHRSDWCPSGNCPKQKHPTYTKVTHLIVHHSAGTNLSTDWAAVVRSIWWSHKNLKKWNDIGYNYLIDPNGVIYEGRGNNVLGAHFSGANTGTMGICLLGDFSIKNNVPSEKMLNSLKNVLSWKECDISKDPLTESYHESSSKTLMNIAGHRDSGSGTICPGDNVYNLLSDIRVNTSDLMKNCDEDLLPVGFLFFKAIPKENYVLIEWSTFEEFNTCYFTLEKSKNSEIFDSLYTTNGTTNATKRIDYATIDSEPYSGISYYRLKILDTVNSNISYSNTIEINKPFSMGKLYPNPANTNITIPFSIELNVNVNVSIYNYMGEIVFSDNFINLENTSLKNINIEHLIKGSYFLRLTSGRENFSSKFSILNR